MISPLQLFKCLADETRLYAMLMIHREGELCVCELMEALDASQPKISRHLALLRSTGVLTDTRRGHWVFYAMAPELPDWARRILDHAAIAQGDVLARYRNNLSAMPNRPSCC